MFFDVAPEESTEPGTVQVDSTEIRGLGLAGQVSRGPTDQDRPRGPPDPCPPAAEPAQQCADQRRYATWAGRTGSADLPAEVRYPLGGQPLDCEVHRQSPVEVPVEDADLADGVDWECGASGRPAGRLRVRRVIHTEGLGLVLR